ncbi:MAG: hypothetical protein AAFX02_11595 [Pseudomonadota bacterium]
MIQSICMVQAGQIPPQTEASLRAGLNAFTEKAFGEPAEIRWVAVPEGSGFTAGNPSRSSVVSITANESLDPDRREELLLELCEFWIKETECSIDEVVGVLNDPPA